MASLLLAGSAYALLRVGRRFHADMRPLRGKVVVICGGSRGLGRSLARQLLEHGARVAICGRNPASLEQARRWLEQVGPPVLAEVCDLRLEASVLMFFEKVQRELGAPDFVVANAARMDVGPLSSFSVEDFESAMREIFGTALRAALGALPWMQARAGGTLVFISSIGGRLGVPHLAPYSAAKFAVVGFAEAVRAEVARQGIRVLTVVPGLMRTGSHVNAAFRGPQERELIWFSSAATAPLFAIDAERAAAQIARAMARGDQLLTITPAARLGAWLHDVAPSAWSLLMQGVARLLPRAPSAESLPPPRLGRELALPEHSRFGRWLKRRSDALAQRHGQ